MGVKTIDLGSLLDALTLIDLIGGLLNRILVSLLAVNGIPACELLTTRHLPSVILKSIETSLLLNGLVRVLGYLTMLGKLWVVSM